MKKIVIFTFVIGMVGVLYAGEPITVVTDNWKPFNYMENGVIKGTSTEIVRVVLDNSGIPYKIQMYPWARAYKMALDMENVLIYTIIRMPVRENLFKWVRPLAESDSVFLYKLASRKDIIVNELEDAKKYRIGVVQEDMRHKYLISQGFEDFKNIEPVVRQEQNVRKLLLKRIDLVGFSRNNFSPEMRSWGISEDKLAEVFFLFKVFPYMAFSKSTSDEQVERVKKSYDQLVNEGKIK